MCVCVCVCVCVCLCLCVCVYHHMVFFHIIYVICPREGIFARNPCDILYIACLASIIQCFIWFLLI